MRLSFRLVIALCMCIVQFSSAQDSLTAFDKVLNFPDKLFGSINKKSADLQNKLTKQTEKYLNRLARQEKRLQKKLYKTDSAAARELFGDVDARYAELKNSLTKDASNNKLRNMYSGHIDSLRTALNFLDQNKLLNQSPETQQKLKAVMQNYNGLQGKLNQTDQINKYLKERQQLLKQQIEKFGLTKQFRKFQKDVYYYKEQVNQYRKDLEDPSKWEARLMQLANKIPAFKNFFAKHSEIASLFSLPDNYGTPQSLQGLQARADVQQLIQQRIQSGGPNAQAYVQQNLQQAQAQLTQLKEKVRSGSIGEAGEEMPDFKPNTQKTKSFLKRLEYGSNIQSVKANGYFPTTSDIGLSVGYRLNDKSIIGIGASYKIGWGPNIRNISLTSEGIGLRSFIDWKLKGSFYVSGGYEQNYRSRFNTISILQNFNAWQQSALLGISKKYKVSKKLKGDMKVMYDFMHKQMPGKQPIVFRIGYSLK